MVAGKYKETSMVLSQQCSIMVFINILRAKKKAKNEINKKKWKEIIVSFLSAHFLFDLPELAYFFYYLRLKVS